MGCPAFVATIETAALAVECTPQAPGQINSPVENFSFDEKCGLQQDQKDHFFYWPSPFLSSLQEGLETSSVGRNNFFTPQP